MSSADWKYDRAARKWFAWSNRGRCYVYEDGTTVPQSRLRQAGVDDDAVDAGPSSLVTRTNALTTAEISPPQWIIYDRVGVRSQWQVWPSQQLTDRNAPHSRTYRRKFIRGDGGDGSSGGFAGYAKSPKPRDDFKFGRVVEILYVSPSARTESAVTRLTPTSNTTDGSAIRARTRRFVVIVGPTETATSFTALPINTYNGRGVAPSEVIKSHHTIIHTSKYPPRPQNDELPRRLQNGHLETPMREPPIRVETYDRAQALDPLSRLDFCDVYEFDFNSPMRLFGRVHEHSRANLELHYRTIWRDVRLSAGQDAGVGRIVNPATPLPGPGPSPFASGSNATTSRNDCEARIRSRLAELQTYADDHELQRPRMTQTQLNSFIANPQLFSNYENQVQNRWREELAARRDDSEEESEEEESDESEEEEDSDDDARRQTRRRHPAS